MVSCIGNLGKVGINVIPVAFNQQINAILPFPDVALPEFVFFQVQSDVYRNKLSGISSATTISIVNKKKFDSIPLRLAPISEQRRIVEKIETLFARLDQGEAALRHTQTLLARYRQSVLKAAVTGALTADWRAANAHRLEHGRDLLARILQTRRETWQGRGKYQEPAAPDTSNLPELPAGWVWASVGTFGDVKGGKRLPNGHAYSAEKTRYPYLRVVDFHDYGVDSSHLKFLTEETALEIARYTISDRDTYISIAGTIGTVGVVPAELSGANLTENAAKISGLQGMDPKFLAFWLSSADGRSEIRKRTISTTQPKLALFRIADIPVPVLSVAEQEKIVELVEQEFQRLNKLAEWCQTELTRSAALRQSILKDAFAGKLVPQDPTDEPAAELLARIHAGRPAPTRKKARA